MTKYLFTLAALLFAAAPSYISSAHAENAMAGAVGMDASTAEAANATETQSGDEHTEEATHEEEDDEHHEGEEESHEEDDEHHEGEKESHEDETHEGEENH